MADLGRQIGRRPVVTMATPSLDLVYAAIFGTPPGSEVAGSLLRVERYLGRAVTPATAILLCITLRPIDLYTMVLSAAERQLHDARLMLGTAITELRSTEALIIAHQNETIKRLTDENRVLRQIIGAERRTASSRSSKLLMSTLIVITAICFGWFAHAGSPA